MKITIDNLKCCANCRRWVYKSLNIYYGYWTMECKLKHMSHSMTGDLKVCNMWSINKEILDRKPFDYIKYNKWIKENYKNNKYVGPKHNV